MSYVGVERRNFSKLSKTSSRVLPLTAARLFAFPTLLWVLSRFNVRILPSLFLPRQDIKTKQNIHHVKHHSWTDSQRLCNLNAPTPNHWRQSFLITIICPKNALFLGGKWFLRRKMLNFLGGNVTPYMKSWTQKRLDCKLTTKVWMHKRARFLFILCVFNLYYFW